MNLYRFRSNLGSSSGETTGFCDTWYLLFFVDERYAGWNIIPPCIPDNHPQRITNTKCRKNTIVPPDDGPIFDRNM